VVWLTLSYLLHYLECSNFFEELKTEKAVLDFLNGFLEKFLILIRTNDILRYYDKYKYYFYKINDKLFRFQMKLIFLHRFLRNLQILNFVSIHQVEPELF